jgi:hypothetical protein
MADIYKNSRIQGTVSLSTYATLYSTSASNTAIISTIIIANTSSFTKQYRIAVLDSAGTPASTDWIAYDASIYANDSVFLTVGISLQKNQFLRISSTDNTLTFNASVLEIY